jgi:hypothetical protein
MSSCESSRRMDRFLKEKKVTDQEELKGDRVQGFPLFYQNGVQTSVLWPLFDKDDKGISVRPFYNREENEQAILFPLSAWNKAEGDGWVGPYRWNQDRHALFPIYYKSQGFNHYLNYYKTENNQGFFPFYNYSKKGDFWCWWLYGMETTPESQRHSVLAGLLSRWEKKNNGDYTAYLFPYYSKKEGDTKTNMLLPLYHSKKSSTSERRTLLPLFHQYTKANGTSGFYTPLGGHSQSAAKSMTMISPFYYSRKSPTSKSKTLIPLFHQFSKADGTSGVYTLLGTYSKNRDSSNWLIWPLYHAKTTPKNENKTLLPLFHQSSNDQGDSRFYSLLGGYTKNNGNENLMITPFWWSGTKGDHKYQLLFPFYYRSQYGENDRKWLFPWYSFKNGTEKTQALFPFYFRNQYGENDRKWLFPYFSSQCGDEKQQMIFPFMWRKSTPRTDRWITPLSYYERTGNKKTNNILPLYFSKEQGDKSSKHLLPLYFSGQDKEKSYNTLLPFYYKGKSETRESLFTALYSRSRDGESAGFTNYFGPLYHHEFSDNYSYSSFLWPLTHFSQNGEDRYKNFAELYRYQKESGATERSYLFRIAAQNDHGWRVTPFIGNDYDAEASPWNKLSLYHSERDQEGEKSVRMWPFFSYSESSKKKSFIYRSSLFTRFNTENKSSWNLTPLFGSERIGEQGKLSLLPFYWHKKEEGETSQAYYLAGLGARDSHGWRISPFVGSDYDREASSWNKLSLYHTELDDEDKRSTRLWPFYSYSESKNANRFIYRSSFFSRVKTEDRSTWNMTPLFGGQKTANKAKVTLFPFYWHDKKSDEITHSNALAGFFGNDPEGWRLSPLISKRRDKSNSLHYLNLIQYTKNKRENDLLIFPLYHSDEKRNEEGDLIEASWSAPYLLSLFSHKKSVTEENNEVLMGLIYKNLKSYTKEGELKSHSYGNYPFYYREKTKTDLGFCEKSKLLMGILYHNTERTDLNGEILSEAGGSFPFYNHFKNKKCEGLNLLFGILYCDEKKYNDEGEMISRSMGSFPFYSRNMKGDDADLTILGFLANYEKKGTDKRFRFPAIFNLRGLIDVAKNEHKSKVNYFYLYSHEKKGDTTRRDIFPGIKWDSGEKESRFSFLWNFYERHEIDGKKGGHIFFIPWGS